MNLIYHGRKSFQDFLKGNEVIFVPPYQGGIVGIDGFTLETKHIDTTIGYVPAGKIISVNSSHHAQQEHSFYYLIKRFGLSIILTGDDSMPNNYYVILFDGKCIAVVNRQSNPFKHRHNSFGVFETPRNITYMPGKFGGSVKCAVNSSPTRKLWDVLGIRYERWGERPQKPDYATH